MSNKNEALDPTQSAGIGSGEQSLQTSWIGSGCDCDICRTVNAQNRPVVQQFRESADYAAKQAEELREREQRNRRAAELLAKHPEFDDLLELLSIVPVKFIRA